MDDTDKKLLESAAKAFGLVIDGWHNDADGVPVILYVNERGGHSFFQPLLANKLTDCMGDALRLAVKLDIDLLFKPRAHAPSTLADYGNREPHDGDPYAATRRAIVRAASEVGRTMK